MLQQYLPFTVLKRPLSVYLTSPWCVATVLTVYGIETFMSVPVHLFLLVATVLTVYGIETLTEASFQASLPSLVATVLTVYGIETLSIPH